MKSWGFLRREAASNSGDMFGAEAPTTATMGSVAVIVLVHIFFYLNLGFLRTRLIGTRNSVKI